MSSLPGTLRSGDTFCRNKGECHAGLILLAVGTHLQQNEEMTKISYLLGKVTPRVCVISH